MANTIAGRRGYMPFRAWLYHQRQEPTPIGNIARAVMFDRCLMAIDARHINGFVQHFQAAHHASDEDLAALGAAWIAYQQYKYRTLHGE